MTRYLIRQLFASIIKLILFLTFMFFFIQIMMPGDYVDQFAMWCNEECRTDLRIRLGLDLPIWARYVQWLKQIVTLDLGNSFNDEPIIDILKNVVPPTVLVFLTGTILAFLIGMWLGKHTAWRKSSIVSRITTLGGITLFTSFPPWLTWLVAYGLTRGTQFAVMGEMGGLRGGLRFEGLRHELWDAVEISPVQVINRIILTLIVSIFILIILNKVMERFTKRTIGQGFFLFFVLAITVGSWYILDIEQLVFDVLRLARIGLITFVLISFGETMLIMQSSLTEVLKEEYIITAQAKGLPEKVVREKHAVRNAILPVLTRLVISIPYLITGVVIIESSVSWPGMGTAMWNGLYWQNMPVVMNILLLVGILALVARLVLDIVNAYLDPRIRYGENRRAGSA